MLSLDAQFKILQGFLLSRYGARVSVIYRQHTALEDEVLRRRALPLPAVAVDGEIILRGRLHVRVITDRLTAMGISATSDK
ncbi:MAG: hypothetical protein IBX71_03500 [Candidatus Desulforudis sp.]|nr:hypothetical protein [Desulforudis sp.]